MYDIIIVGCGPAGLTAAIYALRANKKVLILEKDNIGGQITSSLKVENFPGFKQISGNDLMNNLYEQAIDLGCEINIEEVIKIKDGKIKTVITDETEYEAKSLIIATGCKNRLLGIDREEEFIGNGISFCVACDGAFYKDKVVAVIGGGNSAVINALSLSEICKKVYLIQNLDFLTAEDMLKEKIKRKNNVEIMYNSKVVKLIGDDELKSIEVSNKEDKNIDIDGMFISIGQIPQNDIFKGIIDLNEQNYIKSIECITNKEGIFVAGDCREKKIRQLTTAAGDGTVAALEAINYLNNL